MAKHKSKYSWTIIYYYYYSIDDFPYFNFIRLIVQLVLFCIREKKNSELRMNIQSYEFVYFLYLKKIKKSDIPLNNTKRCLLCCVNSATIMWHMKY